MRSSRRRFWLPILCIPLLAVTSQVSESQTFNAALFAVQDYHCSTFLPPTAIGVSLRDANPASAILGHLPPPGMVGEVAVAQGIITVGQDVPLPTYADGTPARESDVFWTAQVWLATFPDAPCIVRYLQGDHAVATFSGRRLVSASAQINTGGPAPSPLTDFQVLVNVVAVRASATPAKRTTFGGLKRRYR
jgi:hypothetical protein